MGKDKKTKPNVFIIESLSFKDEADNHYEGEVVSKILNFVGTDCIYYYIRTKSEFKKVIEIFKASEYRYLHISCHGSSSSISTTLDNISFDELGLILENVLDKRRLFLSACSATNNALADKILKTSDCYSIIGPNKKINMDDAAIFWASFYHLMFKENKDAMKNVVLEPTLKKLKALYNVPMKYYTSTKQGWRDVKLN